jgi:glycosyltransferase involved in cell wall biosynthesis
VNQSNNLDICLATYNGATWIQEFLDSLDAQTYPNWRLIVSDDSSKDSTLDIIRAHFMSAPEKLVLVQRGRTGLGVVQNFQDAIEASDSEYVLLADQDDVWVPEKLATLLSLMRQTEQDGAPALVFSDLEVVDEQLVNINQSWWSYISVKSNWAFNFNVILCQNIVQGCSMMVNRSLLKVALPFPGGVVMHDWWLLLVAQVFGVIGSSPSALVRYRRHSKAHTFIQKSGLLSAILRQVHSIEAVRDHYKSTVVQTKAFERMFAGKMDATHNREVKLRALRKYIDISSYGGVRRRWSLLKNGFHMVSILRTFKFLLWV